MTTTPSPAGNAVEPDDAAQHRRHIERIDRTIAALLDERRRLGVQLGDGVADGAYQGAPGAFSEEAARALLGADASLVPCRSLDEVFAALEGGRVRSAIVPIENTLAGAVPGAADLLARHDVHIVAERVVRIAHALIAAPGVALEAVRRVYSHPVALAQCEAFLAAHPAMTPLAAFDTAGSVDDVLRGGWTDAAAIASREAAGRYGGIVLADEIQDRADNYTRFLQLSRGPVASAVSAGCKTTVICRLPNEPGALHVALAPFASRAINLTRIESRPARDTPFEYVFHLDIGPADDAAWLVDALEALAARSCSLRVVGHYAA